jgi:predicted MPP superfamily phosphohydrolase
MKKPFTVLLIFSFIFIGSCASIIVTPYTLPSLKLVADDDLTIVLITDLHSTIHKNNQQSLIDKIKQANPDLILMAGDIADDVVPILGTQLLLEGIQGLAPIYYVTGNHEFWAEDIGQIRELFISYGVTILSANYVHQEIKGISLIIAGIEDPFKTRYEDASYNEEQAMADAFGAMNNANDFTILLAHRPERIEHYLLYPFDLIVSGHAHGGQVRLPPLFNGLYAPHQGWFPKYAGGAYQHPSTTHVVSRGLSINPRLPRIFNPPELVVIKITGI